MTWRRGEAGSTLIDRPKDAPVPDFTNGKERVIEWNVRVELNGPYGLPYYHYYSVVATAQSVCAVTGTRVNDETHNWYSLFASGCIQ